MALGGSAHYCGPLGVPFIFEGVPIPFPAVTLPQLLLWDWLLSCCTLLHADVVVSDGGQLHPPAALQTYRLLCLKATSEPLPKMTTNPFLLWAQSVPLWIMSLKQDTSLGSNFKDGHSESNLHFPKTWGNWSLSCNFRKFKTVPFKVIIECLSFPEVTPGSRTESNNLLKCCL